MSVASATMGDGRVVSQAEERRVIFASSLGTVFEWYDFYLYATLAPFFAALFFPPGNETAALLSAFADLRGRLPGAPVRRAGVRPHRRPGRPQVHLPGHHPGHGRLDRRGRPAADLRGDRLARADPAGLAAPACRAWRWAASTAARRPTSPSTRRDGRRGLHTSWIQTTATLGFFLSLRRHRRSAARSMDAKAFADWGWRVPFLVSLVLLVISVYIRLKLNESPVFPQMKARGQGLEVAADRQLPALSEQPRSCCWRCSARPPARAWSGTRGSSTRCSS